LKLEMSILKMHQRLEATLKTLGDSLGSKLDSTLAEEEDAIQMAAKTRKLGCRMSLRSGMLTAPPQNEHESVLADKEEQQAKKIEEPDHAPASCTGDSAHTTLGSTAASSQAKGLLASTTVSPQTSPPSHPQTAEGEDLCGEMLPVSQDLGQRAIDLLRQAISAEVSQQRDDVADRLGNVLQNLLRDAKQYQEETSASQPQHAAENSAPASSDRPREAPYATPRTASAALKRSLSVAPATGEADEGESNQSGRTLTLKSPHAASLKSQLQQSFRPPEDGDRGRSRSTSLARASDAISKADDDRRRKRSGTGGAGVDSESSSAEQARLAAPDSENLASPSRIDQPAAASTGQT